MTQPDTGLTATLTDLADRWDREAATAEATHGAFDGPAAHTLNAEVAERARIYRETATDLRETLATGRIPHDLLTRNDQPSVQA